MKSFIEKIEAEFDELKKDFFAVKNEEWWDSDEDYIKMFIRTALTDFVKLANSTIEQEYYDRGGDDENIKQFQSTLSRLLSGEVEK